MMAHEQTSIAQFPTINRDEAQRFLCILDERTDQFTFQLFDDDDARKDNRLARTLHGTLEQHFSTLVDYSRRGAGVFVTINTTNLKARNKECIVEIRDYFADLDGVPPGNIKRLGLMPHLITETSPGRYHAYYMIADAPVDGAYFKQTQQALAGLFDSDPKVCDLPRVMRLPGFPHQKDPANPFITRIEYDNSQTAIYTDAEFQQALMNALAPIATSARRRVMDDLANLGEGSLDWSRGFAEGQRNNELARRAGSCFARGLTDETALAECRRWNLLNDPPLLDSELIATVASIARTHARKQTALVLAEPAAAPAMPEFVFDGDVAATPPRMLVKNLLPVSGIAFIGGQSSAGKTFVAIALGVALASGAQFFQHRVKQQVGVLYIAAEGAGNFAARVAAAKIEAGIKGPIPFAWTSIVPALRVEQEVVAFVNKLRTFAQQMQQRYGVRLGAVFIDTVAACFSMQDENSNAEVSRVCAIMRYIGNSIGAVVVPIHHYGKDAGTGLRGASAWRGAADVVISVTADIDPTTGRIGNRGLAIAKARDAEQGPVAPFRLDYVKLGTDEDGEEFGTCVVRADPEREQQTVARLKGPKWVTVLDGACKQAAGQFGQDVQTGKEGRKIRTVELRHVKAKFCAMYVTGDDDPRKAKQACEKAWQRAILGMPERLPGYAITKGQDGREWLYLVAREPVQG
jgi:AAA domain/RepB DNA-primase from phage plasmid/Primase C terminal 1 (PriCT-1)